MDMKATEAKLIERLDEKTRHLEKVVRSLRAEHSASFSEQAMERESDEVKEHLEVSLNTEIESIKAALKRIGAGSYETCSSCGGDIGAARLEALPYTSICIKCAE